MIETSPFYGRYLATFREDGQPLGTGMGEFLDLDRFRQPKIQFLLRFKSRLPR